MRTRNNEIHFFLNDREFKALQNILSETGLSCSAYLRLLIKGHSPQNRPPPDYYAMMQEIYKLRVVLQALLDHGASEVEVAAMCAKIDRLILDITEAVIVPKRVK